MKLYEIADPANQLARKLTAKYKEAGLNELYMHMDPRYKYPVAEISEIWVDKSKQGSGVGSQVMDEITQWADKNGVTLTLSIGEKNKERGTTSSSRLRKFYSQFGFVNNKGRNKNYELSIYANMYRKPETHQMYTEDIDSKTLLHWVKYAGHRAFDSEQEARRFIARRSQLGNAWTMGIDDPDSYYAQLAADMPVYQAKDGWHIGTPQMMKRLKDKARRDANPRFSWKTIDIRQASLKEMNDSAAAQEEADYKILPIKMYRLAELLPEGDDSYMSNPKEREYIQKLARTIKENRWFEAIFVHENERYIIEGQHRARAVKLLGLKTIPGNGFLYDMDDHVEEGMDNATFLHPDIEPKHNFPLPDDAKEYENIDSERRGGKKSLKVRVLADPNSFENVM